MDPLNLASPSLGSGNDSFHSELANDLTTIQTAINALISSAQNGASEQSWIVANQDGDALLTGSETPVQWVVQSNSATPAWQLNEDGHTWQCLVAGRYIVYAEPVLTYTVGTNSQGVNVVVYLRPTLAADDAVIYYTNNQWDYWFCEADDGTSLALVAPGINNNHNTYYQSYTSVPQDFAVGDTFHIGALAQHGTGNDSATSKASHAIAIVSG